MLSARTIFVWLVYPGRGLYVGSRIVSMAVSITHVFAGIGKRYELENQRTAFGPFFL